MLFVEKKNYKELINTYEQHSEAKKQSTFFVDPPKKKINDIFTDCVNNYFVNEKLVNRYMFNVTKYFGTFDSIELEKGDCNNIVSNINLLDNNVDDNMDDINFKLNINLNRTLQNNKYGYFVFKGGNTIKYWTLKKYLENINKKIKNDLNTVLTTKLDNNFDPDNIFNANSDFDFSYYFCNFDNNEYKILIKQILIRMRYLRDDLERSIKFKKLNNTYLNKNLVHHEIENFLQKPENGREIKKNKIFHLEKIISLPRRVNSFYVNKDLINNKVVINNIVENKKFMGISANNSIIAENNVDFDLFRIKLCFNVSNGLKRDNYKSEIFDLSVLRTVDKHREEFCENIDKNTVLIQNEYDGNKYLIRLYSIDYIINDLIVLLFIQKKIIFPWFDKKYLKRIIRMGFLYANYLNDLLYKPSNNNGYILNLGDNLYYLLMMMYVIVLNYNFNKYKYDIDYCDVDCKKNIIDGVFKNTLSIIIMYATGNNFDDIIISKFIDYIQVQTTIYREIIYPNEYFDNYIHLIDDRKYIEFILHTFYIYITRIFLYPNKDWLIKASNGKKVNIYEYKLNALDFMNNFVKNFIIGLKAQSKIIEDALFNNIQNYTIDNIFNDNVVGGSGEIKSFNNVLNHIHFPNIKNFVNNKKKHNDKITKIKNNINDKTIEDYNIIFDSFKKFNESFNDTFDNDTFIEYSFVNKKLVEKHKKCANVKESIYNNDEKFNIMIDDHNKYLDKICCSYVNQEQITDFDIKLYEYM